ncbi:MAG: hypothetical protein OXI91_06415 [Chloroflexota bacterium]|nr:hypothetical protein [Chloroflexota bacterium]
MGSKPELSGREVLYRLAEACDRQLEALRDTLRMHEKLFGPLDTATGEESDSLLRLRKVYCHVIAITSWPLDQWVFHVMAPDIRAALQQLRPVSIKAFNELCGPGDDKVPRSFDEMDELLAPFSHPTLMNLLWLPEANGASVRGGIRLLGRLCVSLNCLLTSYVFSLDVEAVRSGLTKESFSAAIIKKANPNTELELARKHRKFGS